MVVIDRTEIRNLLDPYSLGAYEPSQDLNDRIPDEVRLEELSEQKEIITRKRPEMENELDPILEEDVLPEMGPPPEGANTIGIMGPRRIEKDGLWRYEMRAKWFRMEGDVQRYLTEEMMKNYKK